MKNDDLIYKIINEELNNYQSEFIVYRGTSMDEAIKSCELGHLVYYSEDAMSKDWEVIEYGLGDDASKMSDDEINDYINDLVFWTPKDKGVNLTSDLENAIGYSDDSVALMINLIGNYAQFSNAHFFAEKPEECLVKSVYYNYRWYSKEDFLNLVR